jgi:hypothetical protein
MRQFSRSIAALLLLALVIMIGCSTVSPDECWPNTSGGLGGSRPIPIGAGVGATSSGGDADGPSGGTPNPCVTPATPSSPDEGGSEQSTYIRCLGLGPTACALQCNAIGAYCVEYAIHPEDPSQGAGVLKQCVSFLASSTCTYCYANGDACTFIYVIGGMGLGRCTNTGGKGCE